MKKEEEGGTHTEGKDGKEEGREEGRKEEGRK